MTPTSLPTIPVLPSLPAATAALDLFATWTRASYLAAFGVQAPPYNPSEPTRNWFDTSANPGPYSCVQVSGSTASIVPLAVPANVAVPNLPGAYQYPAWSNPATTTAVLTFPGTNNPGPMPSVQVGEICSQADAQAVAAACPAGTTVTEDPSDANVTWNTETRRTWLINVPNGPQGVFAATLRATMTAISTDTSGNYVSGGVGSPGSFQVSGSSLVWVPTPDPGLSAGAAMAVPCAPLWANTAFAPGPLGIGVEIISSATPSASGEGGLTATQAALLQRNNTILEALNTFFRLGV